MAFTWTLGTGANSYWIDAGSSVGGNQYFQSGALGNVSTTTVNNLPSDGSTVYVRLWSLIGGNWPVQRVHLHRLQPSSAQGVITSPANGSHVDGQTVTFNWTAGSGATAYWLDIGSVAGGNQYFQSGNLGNVLTDTVTSLPTDGSRCT